MRFSRKTGFTLVELLVVMSIIGIIAAALISQVTRGSEMARASKCKANLKNLAQAAMSYAVDTKRMPNAGSHEFMNVAMSNGRYKKMYFLEQGWVAWTGSSRWPNETVQGGSMTTAKFFGETAYSSITNGTLWPYIGKNISSYVCDKHKGLAQRAGLTKVQRSYVLNGYFGYDYMGRSTPLDCWIGLDSVTARGSAANLLLFAELLAYKGNHATGIDTSEYAADGVLETDIRTSDDPDSTTYRGKTADERIGFNHMVGKRYVAHVVFVDGHVDALLEPKGASDSDIKKLTYELCNGDELDQDLRSKLR